MKKNLLIKIFSPARFSRKFAVTGDREFFADAVVHQDDPRRDSRSRPIDGRRGCTRRHRRLGMRRRHPDVVVAASAASRAPANGPPHRRFKFRRYYASSRLVPRRRNPDDDVASLPGRPPPRRRAERHRFPEADCEIAAAAEVTNVKIRKTVTCEHTRHVIRPYHILLNFHHELATIVLFN